MIAGSRYHHHAGLISGAQMIAQGAIINIAHKTHGNNFGSVNHRVIHGFNHIIVFSRATTLNSAQWH